MIGTVLKSMWLIYDLIGRNVRKKGKVLPASQSFISAYFRRNLIYLHSAYILASIGFISPSLSSQRTVYETILRGYLFLAKPEEADLYYSNLRTDKEEKFLKTKQFYSHSFLCKELFDVEMVKTQRRFYRELCISSHAEIKGLFLDFPEYNEKEIEDRLKIILSLSYGNIQMMAEGFLQFLDSTIKNIIKRELKEIIQSLGNQVPIFEPNKDIYISKLRLRKGNFMNVL